MSEWKECKLENLGLLQRGRSRHRPRYAFHLYGGKYPFIQTGEIREARKYVIKFEQTYSEAGLAQSKIWPKGTLCITIAANIAELAILSFDACFPDSVLGFIPNNEFADLDFIYYTLTHFQKELKHVGEGSVQDNINLGTFQNVLFPIPPLPEQRAIASVLSSLDDKIDLLHRQNTTLEAMAEKLFRQWFVEEADEGWEEGVLNHVISVKGGTTPSTKKPEYWDGDIYWTSPKDLSNHTSVFIFDTGRKITGRGLAKIGSGLLPIGTVLLSSRAPIGYLAITEIPLAINQGYIAIVCDKMVSNYFIYLWCKANMDLIKNQGNGSVFQEIAKSVFKEIIITIPPSPLLDDFDKAVNPIFSKIKTNQQQIRTLEKLRDMLLSKLMSGEMRVEMEAFS